MGSASKSGGDRARGEVHGPSQPDLGGQGGEGSAASIGRRSRSPRRFAIRPALALTGSAILPGEPALHLPSNPVIGLALLLALTAACAPVCLDGKPPRVEPCHTVVIHRVTGVRLSVDRPVQGWTLRSGGAVLPLGSEPVSLPLSAAGPGAEVFLEGPRGEKLALPPAPIRDDSRSAESHLVLPGDEPATVSIQWSIATDVSECHGAPPETTCGSAAQTARRLVSSRV